MSKAEDFLMHHGVKDMKWGVWNAETRRKYLGGGKRRESKSKDDKEGPSLAERFKNKVSSGVSNKIASIEAANKEKKEIEKLRNTYGATKRGKREFDRLRNKTLSTNDPELIEKGMHTLTESELNLKISRIKQEDEVRALSTKKKDAAIEISKKQEQYKTAKKNRRASGIGGTVVKSVAEYAGKKAVDAAFSYARNNITKKVGVADGLKTESYSDAKKSGEAIVTEVIKSSQKAIVNPRRLLPSGR